MGERDTTAAVKPQLKTFGRTGAAPGRYSLGNAIAINNGIVTQTNNSMK